MNRGKTTAAYRITADSGGRRYSFYCALSGALVHTTKPYTADTPEEELMLAWEREGRAQFNPCHKCGKLVSDAMFNVEVLECVECAPYEVEAKFCKNCGTRIEEPWSPCPACGKPLVYQGRGIRYEPD